MIVRKMTLRQTSDRSEWQMWDDDGHYRSCDRNPKPLIDGLRRAGYQFRCGSVIDMGTPAVMIFERNILRPDAALWVCPKCRTVPTDDDLVNGECYVCGSHFIRDGDTTLYPQDPAYQQWWDANRAIVKAKGRAS